MEQVETLPNAPITEAILDFKLSVPEEIGIDELVTFHAAIRKRFPKKMPQVTIVQQISFSSHKDPKAVLSERKHDGFRFASEDGKSIVQVQKDHLSFHRLKPYTDWKTFSEEGRQIWEEYSQIAKPLAVQRIGLRFLNRIEIPLPINDLRDFCLLFPETPPEVPQFWSSFFIRFSPWDLSTDSRGNVTLTIANEAAPQMRHISLIFDIDVFSLGSPLMPPGSEQMWNKIGQLRDLKNRIFFSCLTKSAINLFK